MGCGGAMVRCPPPQGETEVQDVLDEESVRNDDEWYEQATRDLIDARTDGGASGTDASEIPLLWIELARLRLAHGDESGAAKATSQLRELAEGAWIGRVQAQPGHVPLSG